MVLKLQLNLGLITRRRSKSMPEFTKSYAINRIAELTEIGRSLDAENQQLDSVKYSKVL